MSNPFVYAIEYPSRDPATGQHIDGHLLWYQHIGQEDGTFNWQGPNKVGNGWGNAASVFSGGDGTIYTIQENGDLSWYHHVGQADGSFTWAEGSGKKVGNGWNSFSSVFSGGDGVIYAIEEPSRDPATGQHIGGHLLWYRHIGQADGTFNWQGPNKVGNSWGSFIKVFSGGDGVIYAILENGDLLWYRHVGQADGSFTWAEGSGKKVGNGWNSFSSVFSGGDGVIYAIEEPSRDPATGQHIGGHLLWYRHIGQADGTFNWQGPNKVGNSWGGFASVFSGGDGALIKAKQEIEQFHTNTLAVLSVGSPIGSVMPGADGSFKQLYTFGSIIKPQGDVPQLVERHHVSIEIAAIKCFYTDDPSGTDEPYLITTVYAIDPSRREDSVITRRTADGDASDGRVFAHNRQLAESITIPGDGHIRVHIQLWDEEMVGSASTIRDATSVAAKAAIGAALTAVGVIASGATGGAALAAIAAVGAAAAAALDTVSDAIGNAVGDLVESLVGDDLIDEHDFIIPSSFLRALTTGDPSALNRTSPTIPGVTYNFPDIIEDDSWLFDQGNGTYRVFLRVISVD